jgi:uncharacterized protein
MVEENTRQVGGETTRTRYGAEHMSKIGRKGGETVSADRDHMADIGRQGGHALSEQRGSEHLKAIGKRGGETVREKYGIDYYRSIGRLAALKRWKKLENI